MAPPEHRRRASDGESIGEGWHLDKRVPISIIVTLLFYGISGLWMVAEIKKDVGILMAAAVTQKERDQRQDDMVLQAVARFTEAQKEANAKLDRLIERQADKKL